ncbi:MAG TPA: glycosyltransferase family 4 protein [Gemmatimonadaceae bacterium]|nr:glycosyltransferase family 4 protein [Gemmatimonadaceae bacterium]
MRVALACDWFLPRQGGIELHLRDLAVSLRASGVDARIVTTTRGADVVDGVPVLRVRVPLAPGAGFAFTPGAVRAIGRVIRGERFDVVHAHASVVSPVAFVGAIAARRSGLPSLITFHSMLHRASFVLGASEALFGWSERGVVLSAVSSVVAEQVARWIPGASVGVLPNGIDAEFWHHGAARQAPEGEIVFASAIRLSRKKRPLRLVRAFAAAVRFVAGAPAMRLIVAGEGPERPAMLRAAAELGVADRVELVGQLARADLRALYARSHAFVLPSERESFGIAALEARAAGLPVVAMLASGVRDFIRHGTDGLLAHDDAELSRHIARLALDVPFRNYVRHRNASVVAPYDWTDVRAQHLAMYRHAGARG